MTRLKAVLLNQYIGAIATGYLLARGVEAFWGCLMPAFNAFVTQMLTGTSLGRDYWSSTVRAAMVSNITLAGLYLLSAYLLATWLYARQEEAPQKRK